MLSINEVSPNKETYGISQIFESIFDPEFPNETHHYLILTISATLIIGLAIWWISRYFYYQTQIKKMNNKNIIKKQINTIEPESNNTTTKPMINNNANNTTNNGKFNSSSPSSSNITTNNSNFLTIQTTTKVERTVRIGNNPLITFTEKTTQNIIVPNPSPPTTTWSQFSDGLIFGLSEEQGQRPSMENCAQIVDNIMFKELNTPQPSQSNNSYSFMVFDGHLGNDAAKFVINNLPKYVSETKKKKEAVFLKNNNEEGIDTNSNSHKQQKKHTEDIITSSIREAFHFADTEFEKYAYDHQCEAGAVGVYIHFDPVKNEMYVANVGDCRAILCSNGKCKILTEEHNVTKNEDERKRCSDHIKNKSQDRIGELSITRAIGDYHKCNDTNMNNTSTEPTSTTTNYKCKKVAGLLCDPHIIKHKLSPKDEFLIIACDGLWDVVNPENAMRDCRRHLRSKPDCNIAAKQLVDLAQRKHTTDNVTVMVIAFAMKDIKSGKIHVGPKRADPDIIRPPGGLRSRLRRRRGLGSQ